MLSSKIREEREQKELQVKEDEFVDKLSKKLLHSVVEQDRGVGSLHEDLFEDILRNAFSKLPECPLKESLLTNLPKHTNTLYQSYVDRMPVSLGKRSNVPSTISGPRKKQKVFDNRSQDFNDGIKNLQVIILKTAADTRFRRFTILINDFTDELSNILMENESMRKLSKDQYNSLFSIIKQFLSLQTVAINNNPSAFFPLFNLILEIVNVDESYIPIVYSIILISTNNIDIDGLSSNNDIVSWLHSIVAIEKTEENNSEDEEELGEQPLFYIDTGSAKNQKPVQQQSDEEDNVSSSEEEEEDIGTIDFIE